MKKITLFVVGIMLMTSFISIFSIESTATSIPKALNVGAGPAMTTVAGLFFDVQQSLSTVSFTAIRVHYWTSGLFRHERGVVTFKSCTGSVIIGPILLVQIGPLHNVMFGIFSFLGDIQYNSGGSGQGFTIRSPTT